MGISGEGVPENLEPSPGYAPDRDESDDFVEKSTI